MILADPPVGDLLNSLPLRRIDSNEFTMRHVDVVSVVEVHVGDGEPLDRIVARPHVLDLADKCIDEVGGDELGNDDVAILAPLTQHGFVIGSVSHALEAVAPIGLVVPRQHCIFLWPGIGAGRGVQVVCRMRSANVCRRTEVRRRNARVTRQCRPNSMRCDSHPARADTIGQNCQQLVESVEVMPVRTLVAELTPYLLRERNRSTVLTDVIAGE